MQGFLIWGAFTVVVAAFCFWRPQATRIFVGIFMLLFETVTAALILSHGRYVRWGLLGAVLFLVGITPLGLEEVPNVILAAGMAFLLTKEFPTDAWTMLRRHRGDQRSPAQAVPHRDAHSRPPAR